MPAERETAIAFSLSSLLTALGWYALVSGDSTNVSEPVQILGATICILCMPGMIVGLILGPNVHDPNMTVAALANALLYGLLLRLIFKKFWKGFVGHGTEE